MCAKVVARTIFKCYIIYLDFLFFLDNIRYRLYNNVRLFNKIYIMIIANFVTCSTCTQLFEPLLHD